MNCDDVKFTQCEWLWLCDVFNTLNRLGPAETCVEYGTSDSETRSSAAPARMLSTKSFAAADTRLSFGHVAEPGRYAIVCVVPNWEGRDHFVYLDEKFAALAADEKVIERTGQALVSRALADEFGFVDVDGRLPDGPMHERPKGIGDA